MMLYFITGSKYKFEQVKTILEPEIKIEQLNMELDEIQEIDPHKVLEHKLNDAKNKHKGEFLVEDTSLCIDAFNGLPGPLVKWFIKGWGLSEIYKATKLLGTSSAVGKCIFGYFDGKETLFFEGEMHGDIAPVGKTDGFGWNPIFKPKGFDKVLSEMTHEEKIRIGMRQKALRKFKEWYLNKNKEKS
jgi:non-canonical purine NTP pyrophosphatase (RdgB/HAM1 family)